MAPRRRALPSTRSRARRAFTLIELLVAMGAGLMVALAALVLSRNAAKLFQAEGRIAAAQLAATLGMNRLTTDLARAGFMSTPNVQTDPHVCSGAKATWPMGLQRLSAVTFYQDGSAAAHGAQLAQSTANGFTPDALVIGGSFDTTEEFPAGPPLAGPGGFVVHLEMQNGAMQRAIASGAAGGAQLTDIFRAGRFLRLVGPEDQEIYGVISNVTVTGTPPVDVAVFLAPNPALILGGGGQCAIAGLGGEGAWTANPVSRVRYDLRSLVGDIRYGQLVAPVSAPMSGDQGRTELVRVELDQDDNEIPGTLEVVAEYAVDLKFGIRAMNGPVAGTNPILGQTYLIQNGLGNPQVYAVAGDVQANVAATP
ncbi:MAG TPA: prepilin-type N-terminal cleavage/methylation domain-containing protein, partial [Minicystis sp.]|nr:prepilin-type N-terminal cleavage/methylation domain-containing protein [Minicystis sp.]